MNRLNDSLIQIESKKSSITFRPLLTRREISDIKISFKELVSSKIQPESKIVLIRNKNKTTKYNL
jgi:hypothetical protein